MNAKGLGLDGGSSDPAVAEMMKTLAAEKAFHAVAMGNMRETFESHVGVMTGMMQQCLSANNRMATQIDKLTVIIARRSASVTPVATAIPPGLVPAVTPVGRGVGGANLTPGCCLLS
jgi:hypothetical protein